MFVRLMFVLLAAFSVQQVRAVEIYAGDQSGVLADLYHAKNDFHNTMNKGMIENDNLSQMLRRIHGNLSPYVNQQVMMTSSWSAPIWQTTADFKVEFSEENQSIRYALDTLAIKAAELASLKRMGCEHLNSHFETLLYDMNMVWQARDTDSRALINKLESIAKDADRADGAFTVREAWLSDIAYNAEASERRQDAYRADFSRVDQKLGFLFEEIRACYNID